MRGLYELHDLLVDHLGGGIGILARTQAVEALLVVAVDPLDRTQLVGEAELADHAARDLGGLLDVVRRTGGRVVEHDLLGGAAAHRVGHLVKQLVAGLRIPVFGRHDRRVAERAATRQDRDLRHRVGVVEGRGHKRVATFVVCGVAQLVERHALRTAARTGHHAVDRLVDRTVVDELGANAGTQQRRFVEHVCQIGTGEARRAHGDRVQVDVGHERLAFRMHLEDFLTAFQIGGLHRHLAVEAARAQQRGVEHVGAVRGGDDDQVRVVVEAVHLHEQLVERLLALVVATAHAGATLAAHGVDLVDEDDRGGVLLRLVEQVAHTRCAEADEHFDEVGAGHRIERHTRLAGDGARKQRLAGAWRAVEQYAARDACAERLVFRGILQEVLDFLDLLHRGFLAGHVGELRLGDLAVGQLARVLLAAHAEHAAATAHAAHEEPEEREDDDERQDRGEHVGPHARLFHRGGPPVLRVRLLHGLDHLRALGVRVVELHVGAVVAFLAGLGVGLLVVAVQFKLYLARVVDDVGELHVGGLAREDVHAVFGVDRLRAPAAEHLEQ